MRTVRRMVLHGVLLGAALLLVSPSRAQERPARPRLAVLDLRDLGVGPEVASLLTGVISNRLADIGVFEVINREDVKNMLVHQQDKILLGCSDESCLVQIGGVLGASNLVAGSVGLVGRQYVISLQRIDVGAAKVQKRVERRIEGSREKLLDEAGSAAYKVVEDFLQELSGSVLIFVSEEGADVLVDGKIVGSSPLPRLELPAGPRDIRVSKQGFVDWVRTVQVRPREAQMVDATLIPSAVYIDEYESRNAGMRRWAWISLAAFVALEAGAAGLRAFTYLRYDPIEDDYNSGRYGSLTQAEYYDQHKVDMDRAENLDYAALSLAIVGAAAGVLSVYLFVEGDDPDRYRRFRGIKGSGGSASPSVGAVPGGASFNLHWTF